MKRRPFLTGLTALGASTVLSFKSAAEAQNESIAPSISGDNFNKYPSGEPTVLGKWDNDHLSFSWFSDASGIITDKKNNVSWDMAPIALQELEEIERNVVWVRNERFVQEQYLGTFYGSKSGDGFKFMLYNEAGSEMGSFSCKVALQDADIVFTISQIDEKLPNLIFPTPLDSDKLVLPQGAGKLITKPLGNAYSRFFYPMVGSLNMRFFGGQKGNSSYLSIFEENFEDAGIMCLGTTCSAVWQKTLSKWQGNKTVRYSFTSGGYVGIAKRYRTWAQKNGIFKTLSDKIKETPQLADMVGGRMLSFYQSRPVRERRQQMSVYQFKSQPKSEKGVDVMNTHKETLQIVEEAKKAGMKKGIVNVRGWIRGGYDYSHPDVWPPEAALGTMDEFKQVCSLKSPFVTVLHDNYLDSYRQNPSWPKGVMIDKRGELMKAGYWAGGQAYVLNYKTSNEFAKKNWEQMKQLKLKGMFIDTVTAQQFYESYEPGNESTKADDRKYRSECLAFYKSQKQILGSEESADFGIPYVDWLENRHKRVAGESIPLWSLVFHDCVMNARYIDATNVKENGSYWLTDMLWGYVILFRGPKTADWSSQIELFKSSLMADEWFGQIATAEMVNHEFLSDDFEVERTTFSNGKSITINFSKEDKTVNGLLLKAGEYKIA